MIIILIMPYIYSLTQSATNVAAIKKIKIALYQNIEKCGKLFILILLALQQNEIYYQRETLVANALS